MSRENVEVVRSAYRDFAARKAFDAEVVTPDFAWDMSHFSGWPERQIYEGAAGASSFLADWTAAWDDWELDVEAFHDIDDKVVAVVRQRGRSKATGLAVEMLFAQVWTVRDGKEARMEMYSDPNDALEAVGLTV
jgi:ketosteroid isomerase-like protein